MQRNLEHHTFCRSKDFGIYGSSTKQERTSSLSKMAIDKAIYLLFVTLDNSQKEELSAIMKKQFRSNKCVVLRNEKRETEFDNFLETNGLDIGKKEVVVLSDGATVQFTKDYISYPETV